MSMQIHLKGQLWRLMPLILATRKAKIRRIVAPGQLGQKVSKTPSQQTSLV
jgi:hypothetical protein